MIVSTLAAASLALIVAVGDPPSAPSTPARPPQQRVASPRLAAGQKAPQLTITSWLKGEPVKTLERGTVYVIEFWATWCGPCISGIAHLTALQHHYADKGLVVIGVTARDGRNELPAVQSMVAMRGEGMDYRVAWDGTSATYRAYMNGAALAAIPASFVVGKDGTLEYIGHPQTLDLVVPKILDGTWDREKDTANVREAEALRASMDSLVKSDPKTAMERYEELARLWPAYAEQLLQTRYALERALGREEAAAKTLATIDATAIERKDVIALRGLALRDLVRKAEPGVLDRCFRLAKAAVDVSGGKDCTSLRALSKVHEARGELNQAIAMMKAAIEQSEPSLRPRLEQELKAMMSGNSSGAPAETPDADGR